MLDDLVFDDLVLDDLILDDLVPDELVISTSGWFNSRTDAHIV